MPRDHRLHLHEEILLLALDSRAGTTELGGYFLHAAAGAILAELMLARRAVLREECGKAILAPGEGMALDDPLLEECLGRIAQAEKRAAPPIWAQRFAGTKDLKHRLARQLVRKSILRADEDRVLLLFARRIYPELDPRPKRALLARLEQAVFTDAKDVDAHTAALVALADATGLLKRAFPGKPLKERRARIAALGDAAPEARTAREAVKALLRSQRAG